MGIPILLSGEKLQASVDEIRICNKYGVVQARQAISQKKIL